MYTNRQPGEIIAIFQAQSVTVKQYKVHNELMNVTFLTDFRLSSNNVAAKAALLMNLAISVKYPFKGSQKAIPFEGLRIWSSVVVQ